MSPAAFSDALDNAVVHKSRQAGLRTAPIGDIPTGGCPTCRNSTELRKVGRSTSVEWVASPSLIKRVSLGSDEEVCVLPRSFYVRDRQSRAPPGVQLWKHVPLSSLRTSDEDAKAIARCSCEHNGVSLIQWWKALGNLTGPIDNGAQFHLKLWSRHRYHRCVVIGKLLADRVWICSNAPPLLCSCLAFGLHGRCEHEQACLHFLRPGPDTNLNVPGLASCNHRPSKYQQEAAAARITASAIVLQSGPETCAVSDAQAFPAGYINPSHDRGERDLARQSVEHTPEVFASFFLYTLPSPDPTTEEYDSHRKTRTKQTSSKRSPSTAT